MRITSRNKDYCLTAAVMLLMLLVTLILRDYSHPWGDDFAGYILEAQAIVRGTIDQTAKEMVMLHPSPLPEAALSESPRLYYVWGLPMMLIPFVQNAAQSIPEMLHAMKWINCICITAIAGIGYLFFRRRFGTKLSFVLAAMLGGSLFSMVNTVNTDVPELLFAFLSFYLYELTTDRENNWLLPMLLGAAMYCTCSVRLNGYTVVVFLGLATLADCLRARKFSFLRLLPFLVAGALYGLQLCLLPAPTSNLSDLKSGMSIQGVLMSIVAVAEIGFMILRVHTLPGNILVTAALGIVGAMGIRRGIRKDLRYVLFFAGTFLVLSTLPYSQGARYFMNTFPTILLLIGYGAQELAEYIHPKVSKGRSLRAAAAALVVIGVLYSATATRAVQEQFIQDSNIGSVTENCMPVYEYIRENTPEDAVVAFMAPRMLKLCTNRMSFSMATDRYPLEAADYLLSTIEEVPWSAPPEKLETIYKNAELVLFRVLK